MSYPLNYISGSQEFYHEQLTNDLNSMEEYEIKDSKIK